MNFREQDKEWGKYAVIRQFLALSERFAKWETHLARSPCRVILSEHSESNFFHRDPEWHFVSFDPRFARIATTLRMTRWKKRKAAAVAESRQGKEKRQPI